MPGIVLNPIAHFGASRGEQPIPPYVPTYDSIYLSSEDLYKVSGSVLGGTDGGISKIDFNGIPDTTWNTATNVGNGTGRTLKSVNHAAGARNNIVMICEITSASVDYNELRLVDKTSGAITSSSDIFRKATQQIFGMTTDGEEKHIYAYGQRGFALSGYGQPSPTQLLETTKGLTRFFSGSLTSDSTFQSNIGDGPTNGISNTHNVLDVYVNPNGKIGVAHTGTEWDNNTGKYQNFVVLNNDGTVDSTFDFGNATFKENGAEIQNGAVYSCLWAESGSSGVWIVAGKFKEFGTSASSASYQKIMAFNEDGSINTGFTTNINNSGTPNADIRGIFEAGENYFIALGNFTSPTQKVVAYDFTGNIQIGLNNPNNNNSYEGVAYQEEVYFLHEGSASYDNNNNVRNSQGIGAIGAYNFLNKSTFDIGDGLQTSTNGTSIGASIFLG